MAENLEAPASEQAEQNGAPTTLVSGKPVSNAIAYPSGAMEYLSTSYNGKAEICLDPGSRYPFKFQIGKAKLILEHLDAIRAFVKRNK